MPETGSRGPACIIPTLRYRDAPSAIEFLCRAFGFTRHAVYPGEHGTVAHAELTLGNGMIMLGSVSDSEFQRFMRQPSEAGGCTQTLYVVVGDPDAHFATAKAAGAEILMELTDQDYGGRDYTARDPEGHVWTFGSYDPWAVGGQGA
jgi:uncharacterized glyoxalase superfamily protein PhnB